MAAAAADRGSGVRGSVDRGSGVWVTRQRHPDTDQDVRGRCRYTFVGIVKAFWATFELWHWQNPVMHAA